MEMRKMEELKDKLMRDLDTISNKNALTANDVDLIKKLTSSVKNIGKIMEMEEQGSGNAGYSGRHYVRGHYSRDNGSYAENSYGGGSYGESYGRGSYGGSYSENSYGGGMKEMLEKEYRNARDEREKEVIRKMMDRM